VSGLTPSQTVGPFFRIGLHWPERWRLAADLHAGPRITLRGRVLDGDGAAVPDALIEIWQADSEGRYHADRDTGFCGAGRCAVDNHGSFCFETRKPGRVALPDGRLQAPHINLLVLARGLLLHLYTRVYFAADAAVFDDDVVLACVPSARRGTLIAQPVGEEHVFDIHLQGEHETVFFEL
jgi:protocatechuate 3,4-dioxygenase, alpha subunit